MTRTLSRLLTALLLTATFAVSSCTHSHPNATHRGDLLDDKVTAQRVQQALASAGSDFSKVRVGVTNGLVVLTGWVSSPQLRSRAEALALNAHRTKKVDNRVQLIGNPHETKQF